VKGGGEEGSVGIHRTTLGEWSSSVPPNRVANRQHGTPSSPPHTFFVGPLPRMDLDLYSLRILMESSTVSKKDLGNTVFLFRFWKINKLVL